MERSKGKRKDICPGTAFPLLLETSALCLKEKGLLASACKRALPSKGTNHGGHVLCLSVDLADGLRPPLCILWCQTLVHVP